jgi:hypothetical protein
MNTQTGKKEFQTFSISVVQPTKPLNPPYHLGWQQLKHLTGTQLRYTLVGGDALAQGHFLSRP